MTPYIAQSGAAIWNSGAPTENTSDVTCNVTGVTAGNLLSIKILALSSGGALAPTVTVSGAGNSTTARGITRLDPSVLGFYDCRLATGGNLTVTLAKNGRSCVVVLEVKELASVSVSSPIDSAFVTASGSTTNATSTITTVGTETWIEAGYSSYKVITMGSPASGFTQGYDLDNAAGYGHLSSEYGAGPGTPGAATYGWPAITNGSARTWLIGAVAYAGAAPAPVLSDPDRDNITSNGVRGTFTSNIGTGTSYLAVSASATPPSEAQILAGSGGGIVGYGTGALVAGANAITLASGLTSSTAYYCHMMASNGLSSNIITTTQFTTLAQSPVITGVSDLTPQEGDTLLINSAGGSTGFGDTEGMVVIGGASATVTAWSDTVVTATVGIGTNMFGVTVDVVVGNIETGLSSAGYALTSILPPSGYGYRNLGAPNTTPGVQMITATPALVATNQVEYETLDGLIEVLEDHTVNWDPSASGFFARAHDGTEWGAWAYITLSDGAAIALTINEVVSSTDNPQSNKSVALVIAESAAASTSQIVTGLLASLAITETLTSNDSTSSAASAPLVVVEEGSLIDSQILVLFIPLAFSDTVTCVESLTALMSAAKVVADSLSLADTNSSIRTIPTTIDEVGTLSTLEGADLSSDLIITENGNILDQINLGAVLPVSINEAAAAGDSQTAEVVAALMVVEAGSLSEALAVFISMHHSMTEGVSLLDSASAGATMELLLSEMLSIIDHSYGIAGGASEIAETVVMLDMQSPTVLSSLAPDPRYYAKIIRRILYRLITQRRS